MGGGPRPAADGARRRRPRGSDLAPGAIEAFTSVQVALSALDRLEVRGRDSAGLHLFVHDHGLDLDDPASPRLLDERHDPLFGSGAVRHAGDSLSFVYKAAAEIGELGDNTATLRRADPRRRSPAPRARGRDGPGRRAGAHALGERRHHLRSERAPRQQRGSRARRRSVRHRRAQRRRRQLRRPRGDRATRRPDRDHDRRQGHPDARLAPARRRRGGRRGVPRDRRLARGLGGDRRRGRRPSGEPPARPARERAGAVRRPGRGHLRRRQRALRARRGDVRRTCAWTARRPPTRSAPAPPGARS